MSTQRAAPLQPLLRDTITLFTSLHLPRLALLDDAYALLYRQNAALALQLATANHYHAFLFSRPLAVLLVGSPPPPHTQPLTQKDAALAEAALLHFAQYHQAQLVPVAEQWPLLAQRVLKPFPEEWWRILMRGGSPSFDDIVVTIQAMTHRHVKQEALAALWLLGVAQEQPEDVMTAISNVREEIDAALELVEFAGLNDDVDMKELGTKVLEKMEENGEREREVALRMVDCAKQDGNVMLALLHRALCIDEPLMKEEAMDNEKSFL